MKNKVYSIRIVAIVVLVSLILAVGFNIVSFPYAGIFCNIGYGIFGSSLVTLFILLIDYQTVKKESYELFIEEYIKFLNLLATLPFLDINDELLLYAKYETNTNLFWPFDYCGEEKKKWIENVRVSLSNNSGNELFLKMSDELIEEFLSNESNKAHSLIKKSADMYLHLARFDHTNLDRAYASIHTFFKSNKNRASIYNKLYKPALNLIHKAFKESYHLENFINGEIGNVFVIACKINELNSFFFKIEKSGCSTKAWRQQYNSLSHELSRFMSEIYKENIEEQEYGPFYFSTGKANIKFSANDASDNALDRSNCTNNE